MFKMALHLRSFGSYQQADRRSIVICTHESHVAMTMTVLWTLAD